VYFAMTRKVTAAQIGKAAARFMASGDFGCDWFAGLTPARSD
jgi:hypothetical protein